jgi:hypothetical protein
MGYQNTPTSAPVKLDDEDVVRGIAQLWDTNGITDDAGWVTFVNGRTDAQIAQLCRQLFARWAKKNV